MVTVQAQGKRLIIGARTHTQMNLSSTIIDKYIYCQKIIQLTYYKLPQLPPEGERKDEKTL